MKIRLKQIQYPETSFTIRQLIKNSSTFKIEFTRQVHPDRLPWAWIASVKASGENLESKVNYY